MKFEELLKDLDENLLIKEYKKIENAIYISCEKNTSNSICPYCNELSSTIHSKYMLILILNKQINLKLK